MCVKPQFGFGGAASPSTSHFNRTTSNISLLYSFPLILLINTNDIQNNNLNTRLTNLFLHRKYQEFFLKYMKYLNTRVLKLDNFKYIRTL